MTRAKEHETEAQAELTSLVYLERLPLGLRLIWRAIELRHQKRLREVLVGLQAKGRSPVQIAAELKLGTDTLAAFCRTLSLNLASPKAAQPKATHAKKQSEAVAAALHVRRISPRTEQDREVLERRHYAINQLLRKGRKTQAEQLRKLWGMTETSKESTASGSGIG